MSVFDGRVHSYARFDGILPASGALFGWQDTAHGGLSQSISDVSGGEVVLLNDGQGFATSSEYTVPGVNNVWSTSSNTLELSELQEGDVATLRLDVEVTPEVVPCRLSVELRFYDGAGASGSLVFTAPVRRTELTSGAGTAVRIVESFPFYVGPAVASGSAQIVLASSAGVTVDVQGWFLAIGRSGNA